MVEAKGSLQHRAIGVKAQHSEKTESADDSVCRQLCLQTQSEKDRALCKRLCAHQLPCSVTVIAGPYAFGKSS